jgi:hypothetical protein
MTQYTLAVRRLDVAEDILYAFWDYGAHVWVSAIEMTNGDIQITRTLIASDLPRTKAVKTILVKASVFDDRNASEAIREMMDQDDA